MPGRNARQIALTFGFAAAMAVAGSTAAMAGTIQPHAEQAVPDSAQGCSGNACIYLGNAFQKNGEWYVYVAGCVWKTTVNNTYIKITSPNRSYKSATGTWYQTSHYCRDGDDHYGLDVGPNPPTGTWCSATYTAGRETGQACENLKSYDAPIETSISIGAGRP
jgi:hypothetical protein